MSERILFGLDLAALPQGAAVMTGLSAATQPHWARLITDSSPTGELCGATWHHSTRFSSRLPLGLCWQWVSLEFTLPVNNPPSYHQTNGNWWIIGSALLFLDIYAMCSCAYCVMWGCVHEKDANTHASVNTQGTRVHLHSLFQLQYILRYTTDKATLRTQLTHHAWATTVLIPTKPQLMTETSTATCVYALACVFMGYVFDKSSWITVSNQTPVQRSRKREVFVLPNQPPAQEATGSVPSAPGDNVTRAVVLF